MPVGSGYDLCCLRAKKCCLSARQFCEAFRGRLERLILLTKAESYQLRSHLRVVVERRSGHTRDTDLANEVLCELNIVPKPERRDVAHYVIRTLRIRTLESRILQHR